MKRKGKNLRVIFGIIFAVAGAFILVTKDTASSITDPVTGEVIDGLILPLIEAGKYWLLAIYLGLSMLQSIWTVIGAILNFFAQDMVCTVIGSIIVTAIIVIIFWGEKIRWPGRTFECVSIIFLWSPIWGALFGYTGIQDLQIFWSDVKNFGTAVVAAFKSTGLAIYCIGMFILQCLASWTSYQYQGGVLFFVGLIMLVWPILVRGYKRIEADMSYGDD